MSTTHFSGGVEALGGGFVSDSPTAAKGSLQVIAADSAGNTATVVTNASQSGARTYTIPDAGASATFAMSVNALTPAQLDVLAGVTPGTAAASKALVLNSGSAITTGLTALTATTLTGTTVVATNITIGATAMLSTAAEIDIQCDLSVQTETIAAAGAVSAVKRISKLALVGAGAVTLAAPNAALLGAVKVIEMTADNGDVTLALTNVDGQSSGTTATFNDVGDAMVFVAGVSKWHVCSECGVTLS